MDSVNPVILVTAGTAVVGLLAAMSVCMKNSAPQPKLAPATPKSTPKQAVSTANVTEVSVDAKKKKKPKKKAGNSQELLQDQIQGLEEDEVPSPPSQTNLPSKINVIPQEISGKAKSKVKSPTPVSTTVPAAGTYAAASVTPAPAPTPAPIAAPVAAPSGAKTEKSKSKSVTAPAVAPVAPVKKAVDPAPVVQKAAVEPVDELAIYRFEAGIDDNSWNVVEDKRKAKFNDKIKQPKPSDKPVATAAVDATSGAGASAAPAIETTTAQVSVDVKKVGIIIGPKGVTLKAIQEATGAEIQTPKDRDSTKEGNVNITITGPAEGVAAATKIVNDLSSKGYSAALEGEDFSEGFASVHPTHVMELVGKGGSIRKAIQDHTGVRITIPANVSREQTANVKVGLAGVKGKVTEAKKIIKELIKFKHHPLTHPGAIHQELDVPSALYNVIIGARGSEIKQIQGNYKVSVHIPNEHSAVQSVLIVGEAKAVESAVKYIHKILEQATRDRTAAVDTAEIWAETAAAQEEEVTEDWMQEFVHPSKRKVTAAASSVAASSATTVSAGAWGAGVVTAAEGW